MISASSPCDGPASPRGPVPRSQLRTRRLAEIGLGVALATVLSGVVVYAMPQGGSVTLASLVPLWLLALRYGVSTGVTAGVVHGCIQVVLGKGLFHPVQILLDYPVAYGAQGLAGWQGPGGRRAGIALAMLARLLAHSVASVVFFLPPEMPLSRMAVAALSYNGPFVLVDGLVAVCVLEALLQTRPELGSSLAGGRQECFGAG